MRLRQSVWHQKEVRKKNSVMEKSMLRAKMPLLLLSAIFSLWIAPIVLQPYIVQNTEIKWFTYWFNKRHFDIQYKYIKIWKYGNKDLNRYIKKYLNVSFSDIFFLCFLVFYHFSSHCLETAMRKCLNFGCFKLLETLINRTFHCEVQACSEPDPCICKTSYE